MAADRIGRRERRGIREIGTVCLAALLPGLLSAFAEQPAGDPVAVVYPACRDGYQRQGSFYDFTLRRTWVVLASCGHPEMPRRAVAAGEATRQAFEAEIAPAGRPVETVAPRAMAKPDRGIPAPLRAEAPFARPLVTAGERVRLWRLDEVARLDLAGIALGGGAAGATVRVRALASGKVFRGVVRASGIVEIDRGGADGFGAGGQ